MERGFVPGAKNAERACFVFACAIAIFGIVLIVQPEHPPFSGRGALFSSLLYAWFGVWGQPVFCWLFACVLVAVSVAARRRRLGALHAA